MEEKKKPKFNKKTWLTSVLRRASYRWPYRNEALKLARVDRGLYKCNMCQGTFKQKETIIDHIKPVVPLEGFPMHPITGNPDWTIFIERLYCDVEGFQILCNTCADAKTIIEDEMRKMYKNQQDTDNKKDVDKKKKKG